MKKTELYKIEKVPMPKRILKDSGFTALMRSLKVGESFAAPEKARPRAYQDAKRIGIKVTLKSEPDCLRIFRIA